MEFKSECAISVFGPENIANSFAKEVVAARAGDCFIGKFSSLPLNSETVCGSCADVNDISLYSVHNVCLQRLRLAVVFENRMNFEKLLSLKIVCYFFILLDDLFGYDEFQWIFEIKKYLRTFKLAHLFINIQFMSININAFSFKEMEKSLQ